MKTAYIANVLNPKAIMRYISWLFPAMPATPTLANYQPIFYPYFNDEHLVDCLLWFYFIVITKINIVTMKKVINISGGTLLLVLTATPYLNTT